MKGIVALIALLIIAVIALFILKRLADLIRRVLQRKKAGENNYHDELADAADDVAGAGRIAATIAAAAALLAAPVGFMALLAAIGFVATPIIVTLLPVIVGFAAAAAAVSAFAKLYAKRQRRIAELSRTRHQKTSNRGL